MTAFAAMTSVSVVATPAASATVYSSCTQSRCSAARSANTTWKSKGYPGTRGWYNWPNGQCNFAGGEYYNNDGQLPDGDFFQEYDVYPRSCGASRDAYRIVVDLDTGAVWFSPNHYTDFYRL
jgi:hypothetical protein